MAKRNKSFETTRGPKQQIRNLLVKHTASPKTILTLPGRKMLCAKLFKRTWPKATIIGLEQNVPAWEVISSEMFCYQCTLRSYVELQKITVSHLDLVFLDYFSYLNSSVEDDIKALLRNACLLHPGKETTLGITLMKAMRSESDETLEKMNTTIFDGEIHGKRANSLGEVGRYLTHFMIDATIDFPVAFELVESVEYEAGAGSTRMYFYCFKVRK